MIGWRRLVFMSTSDNSSLQPTPEGVATFGMLARATVQRTQITTNVAMPCTVLEWAPPVDAGAESKPAMVRVRPSFKYARTIDIPENVSPGEEARVDETRGNIAVGVMPEIPNVPVQYVGPSGMRADGPIEVGECGLLVFCDRSLDDWIQDGGPAESVMRHARHALIDAIFIPGLRYGTVSSPVDPLLYFIGREDHTAGLSLHKDTKDLRLFTEGANAEIDAATLINIGAMAVEAITKAESLITAIDALLTAGVNFAGAIGDPAGENAGLAFAAAQLAWAPLKNSIKATKGRVE